MIKNKLFKKLFGSDRQDSFDEGKGDLSEISPEIVQLIAQRAHKLHKDIVAKGKETLNAFRSWDRTNRQNMRINEFNISCDEAKVLMYISDDHYKLKVMNAFIKDLMTDYKKMHNNLTKISEEAVRINGGQFGYNMIGQEGSINLLDELKLLKLKE